MRSTPSSAQLNELADAGRLKILRFPRRRHRPPTSPSASIDRRQWIISAEYASDRAAASRML
jgi:hypothetical protein